MKHIAFSLLMQDMIMDPNIAGRIALSALLWTMAHSNALPILVTSCSVNNIEKSVTITCHFTEDLNKSRNVDGIYVQRYNITGSDPRAEEVLGCYWFESKGFTCIERDGYRRNGDVSRDFTILVDTVSKDTEGKYLCQVTTQKRLVQTNFCILTGSYPNDRHGKMIAIIATVFATLVFAAAVIFILVFAIPELRPAMIEKMFQHEDANNNAQEDGCDRPLSGTAPEIGDQC
ncbi:hypothetical protein BaRGS_00033050 [Batillaria attramentaria]|uniref:Ig-like domain-containing protein n=1 Tax=Batillaria attramentaria TaxID=370345 RepID=A0ABD0JLR4_9CAEN